MLYKRLARTVTPIARRGCQSVTSVRPSSGRDSRRSIQPQHFICARPSDDPGACPPQTGSRSPAARAGPARPPCRVTSDNAGEDFRSTRRPRMSTASTRARSSRPPSATRPTRSTGSSTTRPCCRSRSTPPTRTRLPACSRASSSEAGAQPWCSEAASLNTSCDPSVEALSLSRGQRLRTRRCLGWGSPSDLRQASEHAAQLVALDSGIKLDPSVPHQASRAARTRSLSSLSGMAAAPSGRSLRVPLLVLSAGWREVNASTRPCCQR